MKTNYFAALAVALGCASVAWGVLAQSSFEGTWSGKSGNWNFKLVVSGQKGALTVQCDSVPFTFNIPVSAQGAIDAYIGEGSGGSGRMSRRKIAGQLPTLALDSGGTCGGATVTLSKG